jgi:hypothetical protein
MEQSQTRAIDSILQIWRKQNSQLSDIQENATTSSQLPKSTQDLLPEHFHAKLRA